MRTSGEWGIKLVMNKLRTAAPTLTETLEEGILLQTLRKLFPGDEEEKDRPSGGKFQEEGNIEQRAGIRNGNDRGHQKKSCKHNGTRERWDYDESNQGTTQGWDKDIDNHLQPMLRSGTLPGGMEKGCFGSHPEGDANGSNPPEGTTSVLAG